MCLGQGWATNIFVGVGRGWKMFTPIDTDRNVRLFTTGEGRVGFALSTPIHSHSLPLLVCVFQTRYMTSIGGGGVSGIFRKIYQIFRVGGIRGILAIPPCTPLVYLFGHTNSMIAIWVIIYWPRAQTINSFAGIAALKTIAVFGVVLVRYP